MQAYLHGVTERLRAWGRHVDVEVCSDEHPAQRILETARQRGADLVALATHGHSGMRRWFVGSVADKVIRAADLPVLVYHPQPHAYPPF